MKRAVIYARYSSDRQSEDSISAQVRACTEYAKAHDLRIVGTYADEAISGRESKTELRKEYQKMLTDLKKHLFDVVLIHKYDRIARSLTEHVNLEVKLKRENVELIAVAQSFGNGNEAIVMKAMLWAMSEYYSENLASETKKGHREVALKALHNGGVAPFGYTIVEQKYVICDFEAAYVRKMFQCALDRRGFKALIDEMKANGVKGKRGKEFKYTQIYEILRNEVYTGVYHYSVDEEKDRSARRSKPNAIRIEGAIPAIIDKATYEEVQKIMNSRKQTGRKGGYLCSGLVYCANCGAKMHVYTSSRKGHKYSYYRCSEGCGASVVRVEDVDKVAVAYVKETLSEDTQAKVARVLHAYSGNEKERVSSFKAAIAKAIREKQTAYDNLFANMTTAILPEEVLNDISKRMSKLKDEIEELKSAEPPVDYSADYIKEWLQSIREAPDEKSVHLLIQSIEARRINDKTDFNITSTLKPVLEKMVKR